MAKKTQPAGPLIPNVGPGVVKPVVSPRSAAYLDADLMAQIEQDILDGGSFKNAFIAAGLDGSLFTQWVKRASPEHADGPPAPELVEAVNRLSRARALCCLGCEKRVKAGDADHRGALAWLERMDREVWGRQVQVDLGGPDGDADAAALWLKIQAAAAKK